MDKEFLYSPTNIANAIKQQAKTQHVSAKDMLKDIGLGPNAIAHMRQGRMPLTENLAKIADYLDCSVDYLLGRTDDTQVQNELELKPEEYPVIVKYRGITEQGRTVVDKLLDELHKQKDAPTTYSDECIEAILQNKPELTELASQIRMLDRNQTLRAIDYLGYLLAEQDKN